MNATEARTYIKHFVEHVSPRKGMDMVRFADGTEVQFSNMTDDEAIRVAGGLKEIEAEAAQKSFSRGVRHD